MGDPLADVDESDPLAVIGVSLDVGRKLPPDLLAKFVTEATRAVLAEVLDAEEAKWEKVIGADVTDWTESIRASLLGKEENE